jgi:hypothetical protein
VVFPQKVDCVDNQVGTKPLEVSATNLGVDASDGVWTLALRRGSVSDARPYEFDEGQPATLY